MCGRTCLFYLSFQLIFAACMPEYATDELIYTTILYRHGDRTPISPYPNDPYGNNSLWPVPWGELTNVGKRGHYELGKWLRQKYKDLLPKEYHSKDIHIRSTNVDRTLMSAYSNLAGLYEPDRDSNWNPDILWDPIPVHTMPQSLDKVLAAEAPCPKYKRELNEVLHSEYFRTLNEKNRQLYEYLSDKSGANVTNVQDVLDLYDTLHIERLNNFELPAWTNKVFPEPMKQLGAISFTVPCFTPEMARLKVGPLFGEILNNMEKKISGSLTKKAWMYSAHDTTVANVLQALGIFEPHCPPYLSLILIELRKENEHYFVTIRYRNSSSVPPYLMELPGCGKKCPMENFREILSALVPESWEDECLDEEASIRSVLETTASMGFVAALSLALLLFLCTAIALKYHRQHQRNHTEFSYTILKMDSTS